MKKLIINTNNQSADLFKHDILIKSFSVSTAKNGLSCTINSNCTPVGKLKIAEKIGDGHKYGAVFKARIPTGEIWHKIF